MSPEYEEFLKNIQVGDEVDALNIFQYDNSPKFEKKYSWCPARVIFVNDDFVTVKFYIKSEKNQR